MNLVAKDQSLLDFCKLCISSETEVCRQPEIAHYLLVLSVCVCVSSLT